jgi:hypothetical protein
MYFSTRDLKFALYVALGLLGLWLIGVGVFMDHSADALSDPACTYISAFFLFVVGIAATFFSVESFFLGSEDDIWR